MTAIYHIDVAQRKILSRASGTLTDEDLSRYQSQLLADPSFDPGFDQLWDMREVAEVAITSEAIRQLARSGSVGAGSRRAVVAPTDILFGLARMFEMQLCVPPDQFRVFRKLADAEAWLALG